jgi:hypothetical protein
MERRPRDRLELSAQAWEALVQTSSVRAVTEAVGQAMAPQGAVCLFGDPGRGRTAAVRMALHEVPPGWKVSWVPVPVRPAVAGMRRAVFDALALAGRFPHTSAMDDAAVAEALGEARVLVVDETVPARVVPGVPADSVGPPRYADHAGAVLCCDAAASLSRGGAPQEWQDVRDAGKCGY